MSSAAHRGDDDIAYYAADIGETRLLAANSVSASQFPAASGPLKPGRYLIQISGLSDSSALVWVGFGPFGETVPLTAAAGRKRIPLSLASVLAFETHVRKGDSDQLSVITSAGTANVYVTLVSTPAK